MRDKRIIIIMLLVLIPIFVLTLHIITNEIQSDLYMLASQDIITRQLFGIEVSLYAMYDIIISIIIIISLICILLFLEDIYHDQKEA